MTCIECMRWLDEGRPESERSRMDAHVEGCRGCERELRAALEIERTLAIVVPATAGTGFDAGVIRRIHATTKARRRERTLVWCRRALAEPMVTVSLALTVGITWQHKALSIAAAGLPDRVVRAIDRLLAQDSAGVIHHVGALRLLAIPAVTASLAFATAPLLLWISWRIFRALEQLTMPDSFGDRTTWLGTR